MALEIERKFFVLGRPWLGLPGVRIAQGYLKKGVRAATVRVRLVGEKAFLTIKSKARAGGLARQEFEYPLPVADAVELLKLCPPPLIDKTRYEIVFEGFTWELDVFHGANEGLVIAEIELDHEDQQFSMPPWLGQEVSMDRRFSNAALTKLAWPTFACDYAASFCEVASPQPPRAP